MIAAMVNVSDDDSLPLIAIKADNGDLAENAGPASFMLTATGLSASTTLSVNATPAEDGHDFLTDQVAGNAVNFPIPFSDPDGDNTYTGILEVTLDDDDDGEVTGDIKVTLNASPFVYRLSSATEGVITIWDDDAPELEIMAGTPITEAMGVTANFAISAEVSPNDMVLITI